MPRTLRTEALVLERLEFGESDRVVTLLSREHGKLRAIARGARRSKRRFGGALELFGQIEATLTDSARGGLLRLEEALLLDSHEGMKRDLVSIAQAGYLAELTAALIEEADPVPEIYDLLRGALAQMIAGHLTAIGIRRFEFQLLIRVGVAPQVDDCVNCRAAEASAWVFDLGRGGILCPRCVEMGQGERFDRTALLLMRALQSGAEVSNVSAATMNQVRNLLARIIDGLVPRPLKARDFLRQMAKEQTRWMD